jgi:hypothetical protein
MRLSLRLERVTANAQFDLAMAKAKDGGTTVRSASYAAQGEVLVDITGTHVMGVPIPVIRKGQSSMRNVLKRGYGITGVSSRVDSAAEKFEEIMDVIIESADIETRLRRLGERAREHSHTRLRRSDQVHPDEPGGAGQGGHLPLEEGEEGPAAQGSRTYGAPQLLGRCRVLILHL